MRHESIAPTPYTNEQMLIAISSYTHAAKGVGRQLATEPSESGWTPDSPFDHDGFIDLALSAVSQAKNFASANKLFFNNQKLEDNVNDAMAEAFYAGWDDQRRLLKMVDPARFSSRAVAVEDASD